MRAKKRFVHLISQRRFVRYGLLAVNALVLGVIVAFVVQASPAITSSHGNIAATSATNTVNDPLDQLSSADIAVNLARMTNLPESTAVTNQADSVSAELSMSPEETTVISKPQVVMTDLKSRKDIATYITKDGDTIASVAAQFNVTSDSITWSNGLNGNALSPGSKLLVPPVNGIVYTVKDGDTIDSLASKYHAGKDQIVAYNDAEISGIHTGEVILIPNGQQPVAAPAYTTAASYGGGLWGGGSAVYGSNGYDYGYCTWYAAQRRAQLGKPVPANLGDAYTWVYRAASFGMPTGGAPAVGAVAMKHSGAPGHVAVVEAVNGDGSFWISEMNSYGQVSMTNSTPTGGWGRVDWKLIPAGSASSWSFIY